MRKLVATEYVTLDGVMEEPGQWSFPFWSEETAQFKFDELFASDALLLGRVTYEGFARAWPSMTDEQGFADRMNGMRKYVVTTTLTTPEWNNSRVIAEHVFDEVVALKQQTGQDILLAGSGQLVRALMAQDLIDEYRLMVYPLVLGAGKRLFDEGALRRELRLVEARPFASGTVVLTYHPVR
jgi:dihydrofolate reductase